MKRKISLFIMTLSGVIMIVLVFNSCNKANLETATSSALTRTSSALTPTTTNTPAAEAKASTPAQPHFNLEVILRSVQGGNGSEGDSFGHVKFRQDEDPAKIISLEVWVRGLTPNHNYLLQRAVDTNLDGNCTSTSWLTLGKGLTPQSILTDDKGTGQEDLWRDVTAVPSGSTFDIHFQIVDAVSLAVVLTSDCYQYTVR
jgi:hypothetical protein